MDLLEALAYIIAEPRARNIRVGQPTSLFPYIMTSVSQSTTLLYSDFDAFIAISQASPLTATYRDLAHLYAPRPPPPPSHP
jgi:hypothetical protein